MKSSRLLHVIGSLMAGAALMSSLAVAQLSVEKVTATNKILQQIQATVSKLPPAQQKMLDGYANINHIATKWQAYGMRLTSPTFGLPRVRRRRPRSRPQLRRRPPLTAESFPSPILPPITPIRRLPDTRKAKPRRRLRQHRGGGLQRFGQRVRDSLFL